MNKPVYERPLLIRHQMGLMNKFARVRSMRPQTHIDGVPVEELVAAYGSPLFVFSEKTLRARYRELHDAFALRHPRVRIAWSYKTNYLDGICKVFHSEGAWAEVVSGFEVEKALRNGIPPQRIHFNGPDKTEAILEKTLPEGVIVHIDHFDELALAEKVAERHGIHPEVAIRVNMAAEGVPPWSRFGFHLESGQAETAIDRIVAGGKLKLAGLHCHLGTFILEPDAYRQEAEKLAELANRIREKHGILLSFLDLGGGFASHNKLQAQYLPGESATPSFARYAEAAAEGLEALDYPASETPTVVLETGRALVDDAGFLISTVRANKRLPDGRRGVVVDVGVNQLFTSFWYDHDVAPAQDFRGVPEPTVFYGPLCMNIDVVRNTPLFPALRVGERVVFRHVGAYNVTQWMQFITYRPAVVLVSPDGKHGLLRRAEQLEDVVGPEAVPEWL